MQIGLPSELPHYSSNDDLERIGQLIRERKEILSESLRLFEELPTQREFFSSTAAIRLLRGGNRSGKTSCAAVETARCSRKMDPHGKYDLTKNAVIWIIGFDEDHIGRVIYPKLFEPGAFRLIKDLQTGQMRSWRPYVQEDLERIKECVDAPPLIPERYISKKDWAWSNKAERSFAVCRLRNGTEIRTFSSRAEAPQGSAIDLIWVDEDIFYAKWISELVARTADRGGRIIWSVFPHSGNNALVDLSRRAEFMRDDPDAHIKEWVLTFSNNPYIGAVEKKRIKADWEYEGETTLAARDRGEFSYHESLMYPMFHIDTHGFDKEEFTNQTVPPEWTRFIAIDPGHTVGAAVFIAVPPPNTKFGDMLLVYDEVHMKDADATKMAKAIYQKCRNQDIKAFVIDEAGSRGTEAGSGVKVREQFYQAFKREGLWSEMTGHSFILGTKNKESRNDAVRQAMRFNEDGQPRLRFLRGATPFLIRQLESYRHKRDLRTGLVSEEPDDKGVDNVICLQYLVGANNLLKYSKTKPAPRSKPLDWLEKLKLKRQRQGLDDDSIYLT